jgi:hypothetical protein
VTQNITDGIAFAIEVSGPVASMFRHCVEPSTGSTVRMIAGCIPLMLAWLRLSINRVDKSRERPRELGAYSQGSRSSQ